MFRLLGLTCATTVCIALLLVGVRMAGAHNRPIATEILDVGSCAQPCWHGIQPGRTTMDQAETALDVGDFKISHFKRDTQLRWSIMTMPPWQGNAFRWNASDEGLVDFVELKPPPGALRLGDALAIFGEPLVSALCWRFDTLPDRPQQPFIGAHIYFNNDVEVFAYNPQHPREKRFDPGMIVWLVIYNYPDQEPPYRFDTPPWRGFTALEGEEVC